MREGIHAVVFRGNEILFVKKRDFWLLPGGKVEYVENYSECLSREFFEEVGGAVSIGRFYKSFFGKTPNGRDLVSHVYFANIKGALSGPIAEDSISEHRWIADFESYNLSEITLDVINSLRRDGYL